MITVHVLLMDLIESRGINLINRIDIDLEGFRQWCADAKGYLILKSGWVWLISRVGSRREFHVHF